MIKKIMATTLLGSGLLLAACSAFAGDDNTKIGSLNMQIIMQEAPQVAKIKADLEKQFSPRQAKLQSDAKTLQDAMDKLKKDGNVMSDKDRTDLQNNIMKQRRSLEQAQQDLQSDANTAQNQAVQAFLKVVSDDLQKIAEAGRYDLIVQADSVPYANKRIDITNKVLDMLKSGK